MPRPKGSKNRPKVIDRQDDYANAVMGSGTRRDRSTYTRAGMASLLTQSELESLYISDGFARKVVDVVAEEMTRAGIELEDMDESVSSKVLAKLEELDAMRHYNDAIRWSRLFGGAVMVMGLNDGGAFDVPLNPDGIRDVEFLRVYDRYQATVRNRVLDPMSPDYGQVENWLISPHTGGTPYVVHSSRVQIFDGSAIPDRLRQSNDGWGLSELQACYDQLKRLGMSHQWANALLERSQQAVHKIPGLAELLRAPGGEEMVQKRADVVDMVRGILNTIIIDGLEDYAVSANAMTGVPDVMDRFAEALSAVSSIPVTVLMGRAPGGMNSTGKSDLENWYARVESMQKDQLHKPLDKTVGIILRTMGREEPDYKLCFKPLFVPSDKEVAEVEKLEADTQKAKMETAIGYAGINALDPDEIRKGLADEYDIDASLSVVPTAEEMAADAALMTKATTVPNE